MNKKQDNKINSALLNLLGLIIPHLDQDININLGPSKLIERFILNEKGQPYKEEIKKIFFEFVEYYKNKQANAAKMLGLIEDLVPSFEIPQYKNERDLLLGLNKKYNELEKIISTEFCTKIENITILRANKNQVYQINLNDNNAIILKEFAPSNNQKFAIEYFFTKILNNEGLAPHPKQLKDKSPRLFTEYINGISLDNLRDKEQLARHYNAAIDIILAIENIDRQHRNKLRIKIPRIGSRYYANKCGIDSNDVTTSNLTLIHENFYPEHIIIDANQKAKIIDCEHICYGPVELALARLLVNTFHNLDENFVQQQLEYYLNHKSKIDKGLFYKSFNIHQTAIQNRISNMLDSILKIKPKNLDMDVVSTVYDSYKKRERN